MEINKGNSYIPKKGEGTEIRRFRPVAILSSTAKVFESTMQRSIQDQVMGQISDAQYGFRQARSTTSDLLNAMSYIGPHVDAGTQVGAAYFDYKKAFDFVDKHVFLSKLSKVGCTTKLLEFFASYMKDRRQYV